MNYPYLTTFSYFKEHERNHYISKEGLEKILGFQIKCGNFSYVETPKNYDKIFGVTGTLKNIHED